MPETGEIPQTYDTLRKQDGRQVIHPLDTRTDPEVQQSIQNAEEPLYDDHGNVDADFGKLLDARKELRDSLHFTPEEIDATVKKLSPEQASEVFKRVTERVSNETGYFKSMLDANAVGDIFQHFLLKDSQPQGFDSSSQQRVTYNEIIAKVYSGETPPDQKEALSSLGAVGMLPVVSESGKAQRVRNYPSSGKEPGTAQGEAVARKLKSLFRRGRGEVIEKKDLVEVVAKRMEGENQVDMQSQLKFLQDFPYDEVKNDSAQVWAALDALDTLQAYGLPPTTIAEIFRTPGEWDEEQGVFKNIKAAEDELAHAPSRQHDEVDKATMKDAFKWERQVDRLHVIKIVQEELQQTTSPQESAFSGL
jgi:hypothetical protein